MNTDTNAATPPWQRLAQGAMAACLGVMAIAVFINVVLRYGFGSGVAASEELSRLLFVWMVFIGATAAYPAGEHMAFTSLVGMLRQLRRLADALSKAPRQSRPIQGTDQGAQALLREDPAGSRLLGRLARFQSERFAPPMREQKR